MSFKVCCQIFFHTSALLCHTSRSSWLGSLFSPATNINIRSDNRRKTHKRRLLVTRDLKTSVKFQLFFSLILTHMMRGAAIDIARLCTALAPTNIGGPQPLTYLLTPWSRVLLEKLASLQLVKKFPAFYGTRRFLTALTSAGHLSHCGMKLPPKHSAPEIRVGE